MVVMNSDVELDCDAPDKIERGGGGAGGLRLKTWTTLFEGPPWTQCAPACPDCLGLAIIEFIPIKLSVARV